MKCEQIMKRNIECISPQESAQHAARVMRDENLGFLPVCDPSKRVLGTITDRDIAIRLVAAGKPPTTPASDFMTREVVACRPQDDVQEAQRMMAQHHKSRIMCLDDAGKLIGVISLSDIAGQDTGGMVAETFREVTRREARA